MSLLDLLRTKFPAPEYVTLCEVRDASGFRARRSADALVLGVWQSRGHVLKGIEIKSDRGDWLKEKKNPAKAEAIAKYCDEWWLVTSPDVAKPEEIPPSWGWMEQKGKTLAIRKPAERLTPVPIDRSFLACLLRRSVEGVTPNAVVETEVQRQVAERIEREQGHNERVIKQLTAKVRELEDRLAPFYEASGCHSYMTTSGVRQACDLLKRYRALDADPSRAIERARSSAATLRSAAESIEMALKSIEPVEVAG